MKNLSKNISKISALLGLIVALVAPCRPVEAADLYYANTTTANVVSNVLTAGGYIIKALTWVNQTTNIATIKFYDTANTTTTMVQSAYTSIGPGFATNITVITTNAGGILLTNITPGWYTPATSISQATNELPYVLQIVVGPSATVNLSGIRDSVSKGLAVLPNQAGTYLITAIRENLP